MEMLASIAVTYCSGRPFIVKASQHARREKGVVGEAVTLYKESFRSKPVPSSPSSFFSSSFLLEGPAAA